MIRSPLTMADILVGTALVLVIGTVGLVAKAAADNTSNRAQCQSNLHQIGLAIFLYQNDNNGSYPRTVQDNTGAPKPTWGTPYTADGKPGPVEPPATADPFDGKATTPAPNDVTAPLMLLLRTQRLTPAVFVCPSSGLKPFDFGGGKYTALAWTNFPGKDGLAKHLSYSYQNVYAGNAALAAGFQIKNPDATFAVAADMNPGGPGVLSVTPATRPGSQEMAAANSLNHDRQGQNVLYGDGHAEFESTPFSGTQHDNIYTAAGPEISSPDRKTATIAASPVDGMDSILLPTAADIGYTGPPVPKPLTPADADKLKKAVQGTFAAKAGRHLAVLTVDAKTIVITFGPATIHYDYTIAAADEDGLQLHVTGGDEKANGVMQITGDNLNLKIDDDFDPDLPWHRTDPAHPAAAPAPPGRRGF